MKATDLKLIVYLDALVKYRSATKVADALGVTQPAVSAALRRLRELLDDPIMVRSGHRLLPTPKAFDIHQQMAPALVAWQGLVDTTGVLKYAKNYSILASDYIQQTVLPRLMRQVQAEAPEVSISVVPTNPFRRMEMVTHREVDLAIGYYNNAPDNLRLRHLFQEKMVCVMAANHPAQFDFSIDQFLAYPHVAVTSVSSGSYSEVVEARLRGLGVVRRIAITTPSYIVVPDLIRDNDGLAILPMSVAVRAQRQHGLLIRDVPVALPDLSISMFYHDANQESVTHRWFRNHVAQACAPLAEAPGTGEAGN